MKKSKTSQHSYKMAVAKRSACSVLLIRCCMFFALLLMGVSAGFAQTTRTSVASGNWSTASTWSPAGVPGASDNVIIANGHTVSLTASVTTTGTLTVAGTLSRAVHNLTAGSLSGASTGVITSTSANLVVGGNNSSTTFAGTFSGSASSALIKRGTGTLSLTGNSNFTAGTVIAERGTLRLGVAQTLPAAAFVIVYNGGTLDLNGNNQQVALLQDGFTTANPPSPLAIITNSSATTATLTIGVVGVVNGSSYASIMSGNLNMVVNDDNGIDLIGSGFGANVNITVSNGAYLSLGFPSYTTVLGGDLSVATGGIVNLVENATCNALTLGATLQSAGTYGSTASSATTKNDAFFNVANTGVLTVNALLPIRLLDFTAQADGEIVLLNWKTDLEQNNTGFEVQRSTDGRGWTKIGFVEGQINSSNLTRYSFTDLFPLKAVSFYRLRQVDLDGKFSYSHIARINIVSSNKVAFWPNPIHDMLNVEINKQYPGETLYLSVTDMTGALLLNRAINHGNSAFSTMGWSRGMYIVTLRNANGIITTQKIMKQ